MHSLEKYTPRPSFPYKLLTRGCVPSTERIRHGDPANSQFRSGAKGIRRSLVKRDVCMAAVHQMERVASPD